MLQAHYTNNMHRSSIYAPCITPRVAVTQQEDSTSSVSLCAILALLEDATAAVFVGKVWVQSDVQRAVRALTRNILYRIHHVLVIYASRCFKIPCEFFFLSFVTCSTRWVRGPFNCHSSPRSLMRHTSFRRKVGAAGDTSYDSILGEEATRTTR